MPDQPAPAVPSFRARRLFEGPIITPHMDARMGDNVNGPSLIRVPEWVARPLGKYYLYFGHHRGTYIRLATAPSLDGPWRTHQPGVLDLSASYFVKHVASPDALVDEERREIRLYVHGPLAPDDRRPGRDAQATRVAVSRDGVTFEARAEVLGAPYMRLIRHGGWYYGVGMPGVVYRSRDGLTAFEEGPNPFREIAPDMRHCALLLEGETLFVFYTLRGDCPERILVTRVDLRDAWPHWRPSEPEEVLQPERPYEGADEPLLPSRGGPIDVPARQLRDPAVFREDGHTYLLYAVAGERGIAVAALEPRAR